MMWRYYELLTDLSLAEVDTYKRAQHPMDSKKELAGRIVRDFHSSQAAEAAMESWTRQFQLRQTPNAIDQVQVNYEDIASGWSSGQAVPRDAPVKVDKLVHKAGLAASVTEASKKRAERSVKIDDVTVIDPVYLLGNGAFPKTVVLHVGRKLRQVHIRGQFAP
jgi:tyrosyl-tRNA synthetase